MKTRKAGPKSRFGRKHPVLEGRAAKLLDPFRLKIADLTGEVPYLVDNALHLPGKLTSRQIRQIGIAARILDRSGFSLGDILIWLNQHPDAPVAHEEFVNMLLYTGLSRRTIYNYQSVSNSFPPAERHSSLSRPHHDAVRALPNKRDRRKLLHQAFNRGWTDAEMRLRVRILKRESAMPLDENDKGRNRLPILELLAERFAAHLARALRLLSPKDAVAFEREMIALFKAVTDAKDLLSQNPLPLK